MVGGFDDLIWRVRSFVFARFVDTTAPPAIADIVERFGLKADQAEAALHALHRLHALYLEPGTSLIRIANPFSAVPTAFRVRARGRSYFANCAWDALGIPAALHADGEAEAVCPSSGEPLTLVVEQGRVRRTSAVAHFLVPFDHWHDDLVFT